MTPAQLKARLASAITQVVVEECQRLRLSRATMAGRLGITQPRLSELTNRHLHLFSIESLMKIGRKAGIDVRLDLVRRI